MNIANAHGFTDGDIVVVDLASLEDQTWLRTGQQYVVTSAAAGTFQLGTYDANGTIDKSCCKSANAGIRQLVSQKLKKNLLFKL